MQESRGLPRRDKVQEAAYKVAVERPGTLEECKERYAINLREWDSLTAVRKGLEA